MNGSVPNVKKAKAIQQERQAKLTATVAQLRAATVGSQLQGFVNRAYKRPNAKAR